MPLTPSKRFINISSVTFTVTGGSATPIAGVQSVAKNPQPQEERGSGDADFYDTVAVVVASNPMVSLETLNISALNSIPVGSIGTLVWTQNDARNGSSAGGGALIYTLANAIYQGQQDTIYHRKLANGTPVFTSYSSDGTTNPLSVTAA